MELVPDPNKVPRISLLTSDPRTSSFMLKAAAVLHNELTTITPVSTDLPEKTSSPSHAGIEPVADRFRHEARKLVDSFIEMLQDRPEQMARLASQLFSIGALKADHSQCVPLLKDPPSVHSGQTACVVLTLENRVDITVECALITTDVVASSGDRIPAAQVNASPCPVRIPPHGSTEVRIEIRVPTGTPPGCYAGLLQAGDGTLEQAVLRVSVTG